MDCNNSTIECEVIDLDSESEPEDQLKLEPGHCDNELPEELSEIRILEVRSESEAVSSTSTDIPTLLIEHNRLKNENAELKKSNARYFNELSMLKKERCTVKEINSLLGDKRKIIVDLEEKVEYLNVELNRTKWQLQVAVEESQKLTEKKHRIVANQSCQTEFEVVEKSVCIELEKETQYKSMVLKDLSRRLESTSKEFDSLKEESKEIEAERKNWESSLQKAKKIENELRHKISEFIKEKTKQTKAAKNAFAEIQELISEKQKELLLDKDENVSEKNEESMEINVETASSSEEAKKEINKVLKPKVYSCDECGKEFSNRNAVTNHQRQHSEFSYKCRLCSKVYARKDNCVKHIQKSHMITRHIGNFVATIKKVDG